MIGLVSVGIIVVIDEEGVSIGANVEVVFAEVFWNFIKFSDFRFNCFVFFSIDEVSRLFDPD